MTNNPLIVSIFSIFSGAAALATVALFTRQSLLVSYILLGMILGPSGFKFVTDPTTIEYFSDFGIIFLLFLMGLNLHPQNLYRMLKNATTVTLISSAVFALAGYFLGIAYGFNHVESMIIGAAMIFSSTIVGLKLLPTTVLHHQHVGEVVISILLLQDLIAIFILLLLSALSSGGLSYHEIFLMVIGVPALLAVTFLIERYILRYLLQKFDRIQEYIFLLAIGWCLGIAVFAQATGLSYNVGAFIAGVSIAASPIALYIAESLKPLRDFFLILFFFSLGAGIDLEVISAYILKASILALVMLLLKPIVFRILLKYTHESKLLASEVGYRIGQLSEFSLLVAYLALETRLIGPNAAYTIQAATIITFVISSYLITMRYPTPIAHSEKLRRD